MSYPDYSYPRGLLMKVGIDALLARLRSFRLDALACIERLKPPLQILGKENIPQHGPCVITVNHYHREGFGAQWLALAISATIPADIHWVMTGEFTYPGKWYEYFGGVGSRFLLSHIANSYGFSTMPPMPPRTKDVEARAAAVRNVLDYVRHSPNPILGLAPEGHDPPAGILTKPASGVGRFALLLSNADLRFIPVGAYEAEGVFTIHFGEAYKLNVPRGLSSHEKDAQATQIIMTHIAKLLPVHLRGEFA
ncbi:MAG: hypothetical protein QM730_25170 [Anaerolineales bacterium]